MACEGGQLLRNFQRNLLDRTGFGWNFTPRGAATRAMPLKGTRLLVASPVSLSAGHHGRTAPDSACTNAKHDDYCLNTGRLTEPCGLRYGRTRPIARLSLPSDQY